MHGLGQSEGGNHPAITFLTIVHPVLQDPHENNPSPALVPRALSPWREGGEPVCSASNGSERTAKSSGKLRKPAKESWSYKTTPR